MSQFNSIGERFNRLATDTFTEITNVTEALKTAEGKRKATPMKSGYNIPPEYQAMAAKVESDYQKAKAEFDNMRRTLPDAAEKELANLRRELEAAIDTAFSVKPEDLDHDVLTLLDSGILHPAEYSILMSKASNATMKRLIGKHAAGAAVSMEKSGDVEGAKTLRIVAQQGARFDGHEYLEAFDALTDIYHRTLNNHAMITYWPSLSAPLIAAF